MSKDKSHEFVAAESRWLTNRKDRRSAERAVANLNQNDRMIAALERLVELTEDQNKMLGYLCAAENSRTGAPLPPLGG